MEKMLSANSNTTQKQDPFTALIPKGISGSVSVFTIISVVGLYFGWSIRDEFLISAEFGLGYALGIAGGLMMLLLLVYPLRKRFNSVFFVLSTKSWFKLHMALGIIGPLLVLYHCNFSFGSTNSNVALISMLLMVASGLVGRFIYGKIHFGLYGKKSHLKQMQFQKMLVQKQLSQDQKKSAILFSQSLVVKLKRFEHEALKEKGMLIKLFSVLTLGITTRLGYFSIIRCLRKDQQNNKKYLQLSKSQRQRHFNAVCVHISAYLSTIRKIAGLSFYERLFSMWHMLHLPIFFMLIITGFVHVYAVHAY